MLDVKSLVDEYIDFLKHNITYKQVERGYEITTPFLDEKNDWIQLYISEVNGEEIILSDGGACLSYWEDLGINLTPKRSEQLHNILKTFGVNLSYDNCLTTRCTVKDFAKKKHALLQAIIKVNDLSTTAQTRTTIDFSKDVSDYFDKNEIYYMENISIIGKTGFVHTYDFSLSRTKAFNERFCKTLNKLNRANVVNTLFGWQETREQRKGSCDLIVFANETAKSSDTFIRGLSEYGIDTIPKSEIGKEMCNKHFLIAS